MSKRLVSFMETVRYIRLLCFAVTEQLDMNIKSKKNIKHIYNNTMQCNIIRGLHAVILCIHNK